VLLPGRRNGFLVCADLRAAGNWTPVLDAHGQVGRVRREEGLDTGADDYLTKPFLVRRPPWPRLRRCCAARAARLPTPLSVGSVRIDPSSREVWRDGEPNQAHCAGVRHPRVPDAARR
jgi:DNA-binding response OmpR family regulator